MHRGGTHGIPMVITTLKWQPYILCKRFPNINICAVSSNDYNQKQPASLICTFTHCICQAVTAQTGYF